MTKVSKNNRLFLNLSSDFKNKMKKLMLHTCLKWFFSRKNTGNLISHSSMQKKSQTSVDSVGCSEPCKRRLGPSAATRKVSHFPLLLNKYNTCSKYSLLTFTKKTQNILILHLNFICFLVKLILFHQLLFHYTMLSLWHSWSPELRDPLKKEKKNKNNQTQQKTQP